VILGCVPALRPLAKLQLSDVVNSIGYSLRNLASRRSPGRSARSAEGSGVQGSNELSTPGFGRANYQNLELGSTSQAKNSQDGIILSHVEDQKGYAETGIQRTDSFNVSFQNQLQQNMFPESTYELGGLYQPDVLKRHVAVSLEYVEYCHF
jgi:hypothetical protein